MASMQKMAVPTLSTASSYGSCRADSAASPEQFPAGLRVLVVDDDVTCLRILEHMLQRCRYRVTTCCQATIALSLLRERKGAYDVVISDVHMPDMDGFKLLELVGLEMDLPVIMMSADGRTSAVMRGIEHGACDYLIKPVRIEELKNIWQHVVRKKWNENKELDHSGSLEDRRVVDDADNASSVNDGEDGTWRSQKKKRDAKEDDDDGELDNEDPSASKKPRVVWSVELHQQFVSAVNQLGIEKAVPKRILELMNVPGLTRENVASHLQQVDKNLQKFRLYLKRLSGVAQHQSGHPNSFCGLMEPNAKISSLSRLEVQALAASGQIPPQTLAALQAELFGRPSGNLVLPAIDQPVPIQTSIQGSKCIPIEPGVAFGQPLLNFQSTVSKQLPQSKITVEDMSSGFSIWSSDHLGSTSSPSNLGGFNNTQSGSVMVQMLQQQQPYPVPTESHHAIYMRPSCVVVPSQTANRFQVGNSPVSSNRNSIINPPHSSKGFQAGIDSVATKQNYGYNNGNTGVDRSPLSSRSNNVLLGARQVSDGDFKNVPVLNGYPTPQSLHSSMSSCPTPTDSSTGWILQNSTLNVGPVSSSCILGSEPKTVALPEQGRGRNLGFVGKGTCISSRFAVDDIESPTNELSHRKTCIVDDGDSVTQDLHLDFLDGSKIGNMLLPHFSTNDAIALLSKDVLAGCFLKP